MKKITILCPVNDSLAKSPGHLLFGVNYLEKVARNKFHVDVCVKYLWYHQASFSVFNTIKMNIKLCARILLNSHDILYFGTDPNNLFLLSFLKFVGVYRKRMYAWKYIALHKDVSIVKTWLKKMFYSSFDCIFMLTENHVKDSLNNGIKGRFSYVTWGEDVDYVSKIKARDNNDAERRMTFISTGKAYRDFDTLCKAFMGVDAKLKILTTKKWGGEDYKTVLDKYSLPNVQISFVDELTLANNESVLDYIYSELKGADCSLIICKKVNFGVGYTAVLDAMVCNNSIIATYHKDNPIDIDRVCIGKTVEAENVQDLHNTIQYFVKHPAVVEKYRQNALKLVKEKYNIENVAEQVLQIMLTKK